MRSDISDIDRLRFGMEMEPIEKRATCTRLGRLLYFSHVTQVRVAPISK